VKVDKIIRLDEIADNSILTVVWVSSFDNAQLVWRPIDRW